MSLLLDALNKTSASASSTEEPGACDEAQNDEKLSSEFEHAPSAEPHSDHALALELELEPELDVELSIDDSALAVLIDQHPADQILESTVELAAEQAVEAAIEEAIEDVIELELEPELAQEPEPETEREQVPATVADVDVDSTNNIESHTPQTARSENPGLAAQGLIIEAELEPESLSEEILQDSPLVAAYAKAQRRRKLYISGALGVFVALLSAFVYKTVFYTPSQNSAATTLDPVINAVEEVPRLTVELEAIDLSQIPARRAVPSSEPDAPVNVVRVTSQPTNTNNTAHSDALASAYQALKSGQLDQANKLYQRMLSNPLTRADALAGQASVLIAQNDLSGARKRLNELLAVDSSNTYAQSILAAMPASATGLNADIENKTSLLKSLLYSNPKNDSIAYMLGNQLATELKWAEAQSAYFTAYSLNTENAIYALNLAISLDRLGKHQQARQYYETALRNAATARVTIDVNAISRRLQQGN